MTTNLQPTPAGRRIPRLLHAVVSLLVMLLIMGCQTKPAKSDSELDAEMNAEAEYEANAVLFIKQQRREGKIAIVFPIEGGKFIESSNRIEWVK